MDLKAIPSRRSYRNIGSTTDAERVYNAGRCVRHGLHTSLVHGAPVARKALTFRGGGVRNAVGCHVGVSEKRASDVRCHKDETRNNGDSSARRDICFHPSWLGGGHRTPAFSTCRPQSIPANPAWWTMRRSARPGGTYLSVTRCHLAPRPGQSTHRRERRRARAERRDGYAAVHAPRVTSST